MADTFPETAEPAETEVVSDDTGEAVVFAEAAGAPGASAAFVVTGAGSL